MIERMPKRRNEHGQGLVELCMTLPMLVVILAGLVHFGLVLQSQQIITNASRVGARRGTQPQGDVASIQAAVTDYCQQAGLDSSKVSVQVNIDNTTSRAAVTVSYQFTSPVEGMLTAAAALITKVAAGLGLNASSLIAPRQLQATTVMRL
ncbi:MAG: pilus assembly protein [Acidobacteria bacterium]|nr:pilus assembly protein [Acidobacteriota bacterium]